MTSDGGTNLSRCKVVLDSNLYNKGVFELEKPMFVMECLADVLANSCNSGVIAVKSDDGRLDTEVNRRNMQRCITRKKIIKGGKALDTAQKHTVPPCRKLITPVKIRFSYIFHSFRSRL